MAKKNEIDSLIELALAEDIRSGDVVTNALIPTTATTSAKLFLKQAGVIAGLTVMESLFNKLDPAIKVQPLVIEGSYQKAGTIVATISGPAIPILSGVRVALNLVQHASGVATTTSSYVRRIAGYPCSILDTRKTLPGLRALEKYAVAIAGGINHRFGLDDLLVIKNNHLLFLTPHYKKPIIEAVNRVASQGTNLPIEIEIDDEAKIDEALQTDVVAIMLVNMLPSEVMRCVKKAKNTNKKIYVESSGTITLDTVRAYAETGVQGISIGALTHSVQALDMSLRLT